MIKRDIKAFLENRWAALLTSLGVLLVFYNIYPETWKYLFSILLAYLIADLVKTLLIAGGKGIIQFPFSGSTQTQHEGHGYLVFLIYIILGTIVSAKLGEYLTQNFMLNMVGWQKIIIPHAILIGLLYSDFYLTFKKK